MNKIEKTRSTINNTLFFVKKLRNTRRKAKQISKKTRKEAKSRESVLLHATPRLFLKLNGRPSKKSLAESMNAAVTRMEKTIKATTNTITKTSKRKTPEISLSKTDGSKLCRLSKMLEKTSKETNRKKNPATHRKRKCKPK